MKFYKSDLDQDSSMDSLINFSIETLDIDEYFEIGSAKVSFI